MMTRIGKFVSASILVGTMAVAFTSSTPSYAGCTRKFADCEQDASEERTFMARVIAGADCLLDFAECVRIKVIGL
ncbi:MAG: hypothetical protein E2P00_08005 [Acidobacteria bacterium]|nr:MAG: hypothetical protein E2P00_08005 [Acidobacteriota bacterium]